MASDTDAIQLNSEDLRTVAAYTATSAGEVLSIFEQATPNDGRPREAVEAARAFSDGAKGTNLQRASAVADHKDAREASTKAARNGHPCLRSRESRGRRFCVTQPLAH